MPIGILRLIRDIVTADNPRYATLSKIDPADILPNNLNDNDIILAKKPTISRIHINIDIIMSMTLFSMSHLPVIGTYSCKSFNQPPTVFRCTANIITDPIMARATLNSNSAVPAVTFLSHRGNANLMISLNRAKPFAITIMKNSATTNFLIHNLASCHNIVSKKSNNHS